MTTTQEPRTIPALRPACPVCGGVLSPLRGLVRCGRCQWTMCAGCEALPGGDEGQDEDEPPLSAPR
ncbi:MAG: hypothetical protein K2W96_25210 [Gemmataceae bacterium]|nr:hypothetical protein [Gemmataceae bacterium]